MQELGLFKDFTADYFNGKVHVNKIVKKYAVVLVDVFTQAMTWITHNSITKIEKTLEYYNNLISLLAMIVDVNGWYMRFLPWKETINKSPTLRYEFAFFMDRCNSEPAADENKECLNFSSPDQK